jgi:hypothetical protein
MGDLCGGGFRITIARCVALPRSRELPDRLWNGAEWTVWEAFLV